MGVKVERIIPGNVTISSFEEHEARYQFAGCFVAGKHVLDIACGAGIGSIYLLRAGARSCVGVDISQEAVAFAENHNRGPRYIVGDALEIPLQDESVEVVVSFETIEHVSDAARFIAECFRVLTPGGLFIGSTPHDPVYRWVHPGHNPYHLHDFDSEELARVLSTKFQDVELYAQFPVTYPIMLAKQLCVRVLNVLHLTSPLLRLQGKSKYLEMSERGEYHLPSETGPAEPDLIRPYRSSWLVQPTVVIATARK